ncbi:VOC family protein [Nocardioides sp. W7]|uniref:VOC family protein n=1 Tax=Nocardioides sp. W7 TaxID=2931390 RepID=UPI001FD5C215|nr:VOC family protein [Nocardioides sp. W7]
MPILSLGYLRLDIADASRWQPFMRDFLGLMEVDGATPGSLSYRIDEYPARFVLSPSEAPGLGAIGWEVTDRRDLADFADRIERSGRAVTVGTPGECAERAVTGLIRFEDPSGNPNELFWGPVYDHQPVRTPLVSRFVTGDQGLGHVILSVLDSEEAFEFYNGVLGFEERNVLDIPQLEGRYYFLGCNPRQHSLGLAPGNAPGLAHFMVEAASLDDVGLGLDRAHHMDVPMMQSLGRHTNDRMVSFYVYSPEGHHVELGFDGERVETRQPVYAITEGAFWGHRFTPPPSA